jgi:hypothetical protein
MAQTPISASALYNSTTPSTIYTVPATKTAVVKGVLASSLTTTYDTVTVNKVSGGVTYPLVRNQITGYAGAPNATQYYAPTPGQATLNLLESPITLAAGDSISISTTGTSFYKTEYAVENSNYRIGNIAYLNGNYVVVGIDNSTGTGLILTSADGITYTKQTFSPTVYLTNVVYGNGYYVVCNATGGTIHYSTDLITWTQVSLSTTNACFALVYGGGKFVTGGANGASYYATTTPLSWTAATVFNSSNTINAIAYIGTNYFYATTGISYYTADFTTFTQPYVALLSGQTLSAIAASNNKVLATNNLIASTDPNTFLRSSADGITWGAVTTTANSISGYVSYPVYAANGGYFVTRTNNNTGTGQYLYSSDGVTWNLTTYSHLTGYNQAGPTQFSAAYFNTANASYTNKVLVWQYAANNAYIQGTNIATNGVMSNQNFSFTAQSLADGTFQGYPIFVGNPFDGTWRAMCYYSNGGNNGGPFYYGTGPNQGANGQSNPGWNVSSFPGAEYGTAVGVVPGTARYLGGSTSGWVFQSSSSTGGWSPIMGNPSYVGNPTGFSWPSSVNVAGIARGGELTTSPLVIVWANGYFGTTTNGGTTWTFGNVGISSIPPQNGSIQPPIQYNNGYFYVANTSGAIARSTNGIAWEIMINNINNIYYYNSQNIFLNNSGQIFTSATGVVDAFTSKSTNGSFAGNPSTNQMIYLNSTYYVIDNSSVLYQSSDLITWTTKTFNSLQINNVTYLSPGSYSGMTYSGTGNAFVLATARASASTAGTGGVGKLFTPSINTYVGNATASIVQID